MKRIALLLGLCLLLTPAVASANLISDPGFEQSPHVGWENWKDYGHANFSYDFDATSEKHSGNESYMVSWTSLIPAWNSYVAYQDDIAVSAGETVYVNAWFNITSALDNAEAYMEVVFYDSSDPKVETGIQAGTKYSIGTSGWAGDSFSMLAPSGTTNAKYQLVVCPLEGGSASGTVYFDDAYFDTQPIPEPSQIISLIFLTTGLVGIYNCKKRR